MREFDEWRDDLGDTLPSLLKPSSWNELVIMYADFTNINGKHVSFEDRIEEMMERDRKTDNPRRLAIEIARPRMIEMASDLQLAMEKGEVNEKYAIA